MSVEIQDRAGENRVSHGRTGRECGRRRPGRTRDQADPCFDRRACGGKRFSRAGDVVWTKASSGCPGRYDVSHHSASRRSRATPHAAVLSAQDDVSVARRQVLRVRRCHWLGQSSSPCQLQQLDRCLLVARRSPLDVSRQSSLAGRLRRVGSRRHDLSRRRQVSEQVLHRLLGR